MFFEGLKPLLRIIAVGIPMYALTLAALRFTGKRALAKMNAYGLVVTIALGSVLASALLTKSATLADGVLAVALLLALQWAVAIAVIRWPWAQRVTLSHAQMLLWDGEPIDSAMRSERVHIGELESAVRSAGHMSFSDVQAVVLEPDGSFSVIPKQQAGNASAMKSVGNFDIKTKRPKKRD